MKKPHLILISLFLFTNSLLGQINAVVQDDETFEPIEFVNICIENENIGTSSNELGYFSIDVNQMNTKLIFSAVGFETKRIDKSEIKDIGYLKKIVTKLPEIELLKNKNSNEFKIGSFETSETDLYFGTDTKYPWIIARLFNNNSIGNETKFLKKIKLITGISEKTQFNVRVYSVGQDKKPNEYLVNQNIIGIAKKGINETEIDLSYLNVIFPKEGLFIAIENIKEEQKVKKRRSSRLEKTLTLGLDLESKNENTYIYYKGEWVDKIISQNMFSEKMLNLFKAVSIELTVAD
ncbi:carboxypeptidase-like regulatory domain-containing protein [Aquimarina sp. SS2-1]|uniref:carboxypeptidase-like regulatory domain-containing protein n=1 Tax=Aquimarina besae TaxID=3342247 RepID=UPI00366AA924